VDDRSWKTCRACLRLGCGTSESGSRNRRSRPPRRPGVPSQEYVTYFAGPPRRWLRCFSSEYSPVFVVEAPCQQHGLLTGIVNVLLRRNTSAKSYKRLAGRLGLVGLTATRQLTYAWATVYSNVQHLSLNLLSELALAEQIWRSILAHPDQSLTILDRRFLSYGLLHRLHAAGDACHRDARPVIPGLERFTEAFSRSSLRPRAAGWLRPAGAPGTI